MSNFEYKILAYIREKQPVSWGDVINAFNPDVNINKVKLLLENLLSEGLIKVLLPGTKPPKCMFIIDGKGYSALLTKADEVENSKKQALKETEKNSEEQAAKEAEQANFKKFEVRLSVFNILFGAFIGNLDRIIAFIISLFKFHN